MGVNLGKHRKAELVSNVVEDIKHILSFVRETVSERNETLGRIESGTGKPLLRIDKLAEELAEKRIVASLARAGITEDAVLYLGEESLADMREEVDLSNHAGLAVLVDMIDGTDLLERGLQNWCSAVVVFEPATNRIVGAFVGVEGVIPGFHRAVDTDGVLMHNLYDFVYCAWDEAPFNRPPVKAGDEMMRSDLCVKPRLEAGFYAKTLEDASVAWYGQKAGNLLSVSDRPAFRAQLRKYEKERKASSGFRIYNLAGIPMIMRMLDPLPGAERGIDAVFEVRGQHPHDAVPGLFIALRAGATLLALRSIHPCGIQAGQPMEEHMLASLLTKPASDDHRVSYVVAPEPSLALELMHLLIE